MTHPRRLILWDIDGTLLAAGPVAREAFDDAVEEVIGRDPRGHDVAMGGKTDPSIALEIMRAAGVPEGESRERLPTVLAAMERRLAAAAGRIRQDGRVHPGVWELLPRLHEDPEVLQTVLTGNLARNARSKIAAFGLDAYLDLEVGAFGSDDEDRQRLVPVALDRVRRSYGWNLDPADTWIVGDTSRDLACARAGGARCLLVATGRASFDELATLGADETLPDLSNEGRVLEILIHR